MLEFSIIILCNALKCDMPIYLHLKIPNMVYEHILGLSAYEGCMYQCKIVAWKQN